MGIYVVKMVHVYVDLYHIEMNLNFGVTLTGTQYLNFLQYATVYVMLTRYYYCNTVTE